MPPQKETALQKEKIVCEQPADTADTEAAAPEENNKIKTKRPRRWLRFIALGLVGVCLLLAAAAAWVYIDFQNRMVITQQEIEDARVTGEELEQLDLEFADALDNVLSSAGASVSEVSATDMSGFIVPGDYIMSTDEVSIILLVGSDSRLGLSGSARSDSIMLAAIDRTNKKIKLISILRDLFADIPGYADNRINAAFYYDSRYKNLDLKITFSTIKRNLGIDAEDYIVVDFSGFREIVRQLGGVRIELTDEEAKYMCSDRVYGIFPRFEAGGGEYLLSGAETLNYCRMRKVSGGDFGRTARQRKVITQIMSQLKGADLTTMYGVAQTCADHISTNLTPQEINGYVMEAAELLEYEVVELRLPIDGAYEYQKIYRENSTSYRSVLWTNYRWTAEQLRKFIFEDDMTYADGARARGVYIPDMPEWVLTSPPTTSSEETTTITTAEATTVSTTASSTAVPTTESSNTSATAAPTTTPAPTTSATVTSTAATTAATTAEINEATTTSAAAEPSDEETSSSGEAA